jgi:hypothetical protein
MRILLILIFATNASYSQSEFYNPIDGKTYIGDWKKYGSSDEAREDGRVINLGVRLMNTDCDLKKNITAEEIASLVTSVQSIFTEKVEGHNEGGEVLIQITLNRETKPVFEMSYQGDLQGEYLQKSRDSLSALEYKTRENSITLQVHLKIRNA